MVPRFVERVGWREAQRHQVKSPAEEGSAKETGRGEGGGRGKDQGWERRGRKRVRMREY